MKVRTLIHHSLRAICLLMLFVVVAWIVGASLTRALEPLPAHDQEEERP